MFLIITLYIFWYALQSLHACGRSIFLLTLNSHTSNISLLWESHKNVKLFSTLIARHTDLFTSEAQKGKRAGKAEAGQRGGNMPECASLSRLTFILSSDNQPFSESEAAPAFFLLRSSKSGRPNQGVKCKWEPSAWLWTLFGRQGGERDSKPKGTQEGKITT